MTSRPIDAGYSHAAKFRLTVLLIKIRGRFCGRSLGVHFFGSFMVFILSALSLILILNFEIEPRSKSNHGPTRF